MITLYNTCTHEKFIIQATMFPDGTSQVWKLPEEAFKGGLFKIKWDWDNESEFMSLASLKALLDTIKDSSTRLFVPYLPYARQDKEVSNNSTFNLRVFAKLINSLKFKEVMSADVHNFKLTNKLIKNFNQYNIVDQFLKFRDGTWDYICFPDKSAMKRYRHFLHKNQKFLYFEKIRDPSNGEILSSKIITKTKVFCKDQRILIIDDICDGGRTFIETIKILDQLEPDKIDLFVTHGLFSKGLEVLFDAGINEIFTTNSLIRNYKYENRLTIFPI